LVESGFIPLKARYLAPSSTYLPITTADYINPTGISGQILKTNLSINNNPTILGAFWTKFGSNLTDESFFSITWDDTPEIFHPVSIWGTIHQKATTVHWGVGRSYNYFQQTFGRIGFKNDGFGPRIYVNPLEDLTSCNAGYIPSDNKDWLFFRGVHGLDIVAHEFTHGIILLSFTNHFNFLYKVLLLRGED
jgi:hypothetical protein